MTTLDGFPDTLEGVLLRDGMIKVDRDLALHYVEAGPRTGKLVVLLHGFPQFWMAWKRQIPYLAQAGHRVIAPDLRGYNLSDHAPDLFGYRTERVAADISSLITALSPGEKGAVVGHDWGANIGWVFSMKHPEQIERLCVMGAGHPADYDFLKFDLSQKLKSWYLVLMALPRVAEVVLSADNYRMLRSSFSSQGMAAEDTEMFLGILRKSPGALTRMVNYYRAVARYRDPTAPAVKVPVLAIHGNMDKETGRRLMNTSAVRAPDFRLVEIKGGHWLQIAPDSANTVNQLLGDFLGGRPNDSKSPFGG